MRAHTNIKLKDRNSLTISNFKGVDFSSSAVNVQSNRASYMRNLINEGGVNKKRNGWNELYKLGAKINGIFEAPLKKGKIIHAGYNLYLLNENELDCIVEGEGILTNEKSQAFYKGNKMFILCGKFLVCFWEDDELIIQTVEESNEIYIPTTTISIDNDSVTDTVRATLDDINCLTKWRKNTLVGVVSENPNSVTSGDWTLDATVDEGTQITVEITLKKKRRR